MREGWELKRFDEVFDLQMGKTPDRKNYALFEGNNTWVSIRDINDKYICSSNECISDDAAANIKMVKKGTVIMSFKLSVGKCAIAAKDLYTNEAIMAFNLKNGYKIASSFLYYYLQNYKWIGGNKAVKGITLNKATISRHKIQIPPMPYQKDIVAELDQINDLIRLKKEQLKEYDNLAQSSFYDMFGDPVENEKGWEVKKLGELVDLKNGLNFTPDDKGNTIKVIGVADFKDNSVITDVDAIGLKSIKGEVPQDYYLKDGDVLIVRSNGSKKLVGRNLIVYTKGELITYSGFCIRCRIKNSHIISSVYLNAFLSKREIRMILRQEGRGANISNINQKILSSQRVPLPPLLRQQEFSSRIEQIEKLKTEVQKTITDLETLLASRMQYWFE